MTTGLDSESENLLRGLTLPKKTEDILKCLIRHGLVTIMEVTDGTRRIQISSKCSYASDDLIQELKKIFRCDSVSIYNSSGIKGEDSIIDLDYK